MAAKKKLKVPTTKICVVCDEEKPRRESSCCDQEQFKRHDGSLITKAKKSDDKKVDRVSKKNVQIITKLVQNRLEGLDFVKPSTPEPSGKDVSEIYKAGDAEKIAFTEELLDQWASWNEISTIGLTIIKDYKKAIDEVLYPSESDDKEDK